MVILTCIKRLRPILSLVLAVLLLLTAVCTLPIVPAAADSNVEKRDDYREKADKLKKEIAALESEKAETEKIRDKVQEQVDNTEAQIVAVSEKLEGIEAQLAEVQAQLDVVTAELEENKDAFKQRLRAIYMTGAASNDLMVLMGADDVADYLSMTELSRSVSRHDEQLIEEIVEAVSKVEADYAIVEEKKLEQDAVKRELSNAMAELDEQVEKLEALISESDTKIDKAQSELDEYNAAIDELNDKIAEASREEYTADIQYNGGQFIWPCPGYYYISSSYGWRWGRNHNGVDIAGGGIMGKPIVAAADGVVSLASHNAGGYGNYVMINHGSGYVTLYGHMTRYIVSPGQSVSAGQTIGYVGSTGRSTGPHLHFEIRVSGSPQNPMNYF